ncbi:MAG TPA: DNA-directed RNA polymerase subunit omega [Planctomycetota bacterium]|nr:DNA-directed RNA polymerase subunit omega [Planctomycetota bacterium]
MDSKKLREAKKKVGNTFALTVLLQKRCQELVRGAQKLVDFDAKSPIDLALEEVLQGKIWLGDRVTPLPPPPPPAPDPDAKPAAAGKL